MRTQLLTTLENSKQYALDVANAMPAENYDFKPAEAVWNFKELIHHIGYGIIWWKNNFIKKTETEWAPPAVPEGKEEVVTTSVAPLKH